MQDLTGQKFGRLTVLCMVKREGSKKSYSYCLVVCDCGSLEKEVLASSLLRGSSKSCGCLKIEKRAERKASRQKFFNAYRLSGHYGAHH